MANDDLHHDMARFDLDPNTVERLLGGAVYPDDAPPELALAAALVQTAREPASPGELGGRDAAVAAMAAAVRDKAGRREPTRRRAMLGKLMATKVAAVAGPIVLLGAGAAAACTGSLPAPAQSAVSNVLSDVGISVPNPDHSDSGATTTDDSTTTTTSGSTTTTTSSTSTNLSSGTTQDSGTQSGTGKGPDAGPTSPATFGLCTAWAAGGLNEHGVARRNLATAAGGDGNIQAYCQGLFGSSNPSISTLPSTTRPASPGGTTPQGGDEQGSPPPVFEPFGTGPGGSPMEHGHSGSSGTGGHQHP